MISASNTCCHLFTTRGGWCKVIAGVRDFFRNQARLDTFVITLKDMLKILSQGRAQGTGEERIK
jgi:hypothetical protein